MGSGESRIAAGLQREQDTPRAHARRGDGSRGVRRARPRRRSRISRAGAGDGPVGVGDQLTAVQDGGRLCPPGKRVIGGGGWVQEIGPITRKPALTQLRPLEQYNGPRDAYMVTAAETTPGTTGDWWVQAYAMCANPLPGWHIVQATTTQSSQPMQATAAVCPSGERVIGTGARVSTSTGDNAYVGEVVLQVARPSGPGDIARAQAHEDANDFPLPWSVTAYAICVAPPPGYQIVFAESPARDSESTKLAFAPCPGGKRLHSSGAAITNVAPGNVSLQGIFPDLDGGETQALAVENTPTNVDWDFIVATAICAY